MTETHTYIKIAVVDDHNLFRKGLTKLISMGDVNNRYRVLFEAESGEEMMSMLQNADVLPDIILLDIAMPEMDGYSAVKWLKDHYPDIRILIISMFESEEAVIPMLRLGIQGYLSKDIEVEDMHRALESIALGNEYYPKFVTDIMVSTLKEDDDVNTTKFKTKEKILRSLKSVERDFLRLVCSELTYHEIAQKMNLSPKTIDGYRDEMFRRFKVKSRVSLALYAVKYGLVSV